MEVINNFKNWALDWTTNFILYAPSSIQVLVSSDKTRVTLVNAENGKSATAKLHKGDTFNEQIGIGIAWAKYCGTKIPRQGKRIVAKELKHGERFCDCIGKEHICVQENDRGFYQAKRPNQRDKFARTRSSVEYVWVLRDE